MAREWFRYDGSGIAIHAEDKGILLVGDYIPDWVLIPHESPIRSGERARVMGHTQKACPVCKRPVRHLDLGEKLFVAQCKPGCGFLFYQV